jgi:hypothetical protein
MVIEVKGDKYHIYVVGRMATLKRLQDREGWLELEWHEGQENDCTLTLYDIAAMMQPWIVEVDCANYPASLLLKEASPSAMGEVMQRAAEQIRQLSFLSQTPLHTLIRSMMSCGLKIAEIADRIKISRARVSIMANTPYCFAGSHAVKHLHDMVEQRFPSLVPFVEAAESRSRKRLGKMFFNNWRNKKDD